MCRVAAIGRTLIHHKQPRLVADSGMSVAASVSCRFAGSRRRRVAQRGGHHPGAKRLVAVNPSVTARQVVWQMFHDSHLPTNHTTEGQEPSEPVARARPQCLQKSSALGHADVLVAGGYEVPSWVWLAWLPQLLMSLPRPEAQVVKPILQQLATIAPQVGMLAVQCRRPCFGVFWSVHVGHDL